MGVSSDMRSSRVRRQAAKKPNKERTVQVRFSDEELAALDAQGSAVLLARYADPGYATVYKVTDGVLTKLFGHAPALYEPPCTQFLTKKGDVVNAPLIKALGKDRGPRCK